MATIFGNGTSQTLTGTSAADTIYGGSSASETNTGNDTVNAGAGNDTVTGGDGNDSLSGQAGSDTLHGGVGSDRLDGGSGSDSLSGGAGNDSLDGAAGNDSIDAGDGADTVEGGGGADTILGGLGNDVLYGDDPTPATGATETLNWIGQGGSGTNLGTGFTQDTGGMAVQVTYTDNGTGNAFETDNATQYRAAGETFATNSSAFLQGTGGGANATLRLDFEPEAGSGLSNEVTNVAFRLNDVDAQEWRDVLVVRAYDANGNLVPVTLTAAGSDSVNSSTGTITAASGNNESYQAQGSVLVNVAGPVASVEIVYSNALTANQYVYVTNVGFTTQAATDGADSIAGGDGDDTILGGGGNDSLSGDIGNDSLAGGAGNDALAGGAGGDSLLGEAGNDTLTGGTGADVMFGGDGADSFAVAEGDGADTVQGGEGGTDSDTIRLTGATAGVTLSFTGSEAGTWTFLGAGAGSGSFTQIEGIEATAFDDTITATSATSSLTLSGLDGADSITGGSGSDTIYGGSGADRLAGGAGADSLDGGAGADTLRVGASEGADVAQGGEAGPDQDLLDFDPGAAATGVTVTLSGAEAGTWTFGTGTGTFTGIEGFDLTGNADTFDGRSATAALSVAAGAGDDIVGGGSAADTLDGGDGADLLGGFGGADTIYGGAGADQIAGGLGDDALYGGTDADTIYVEDGAGSDAVHGGSGGTDLDSLDFGAVTTGVSVAFSGAESGTFGTSTFTDIERVALTEQADTADAGASTASVTIEGRGGADALTGGSGADLLDGGTGADTLAGGAGADRLYGGGDADSLAGGTGADSLFGGAGEDRVQIAQGDAAHGGDGADTFTLADLSEAGTGAVSVTGGAGFDSLRLGDLADLSTLERTQAPDGSWSGTVTLDDGSVLTFSEVEQVICFAAGTLIATPRGARPVEALAEGDLVVTRDHGLQAIRWAGSRRVPATGPLAPVRIRPGVVPGLERDLVVSPQHKILFHGHRAELLFGESEVLVPAVHLVDGKSVTREEGGWVSYHHILFDRHEIVYSEGAATESFHPGEEGLKGVDAAAREELLALFPELRARPGRYGPAARRCLKRHEARLLRA